MIRKSLLVGMIVVMTAGAVALRRMPRPRTWTTARARTVSHQPIDLTELKPDTLVSAVSAPTAPTFAAGTWINSDPLTLNNLHGRVVLVEFWTFACYNCRNTLPVVKEWNAKYRDRGLTIVGVHTPETEEEYHIDRVRPEINSLGIGYPVVTDNDYQTWKAYHVEAWPTIFVLDKQGRVRWLHVGEGRYDDTEGVIKTLLTE